MGLKNSFMHFFNLDEDLEEQMEKMGQDEERVARRKLSGRNQPDGGEQGASDYQEQEEQPVEIVRVNPYNFEDVQMIIDEGTQHKIVVFNLSEVTRVEAKRMLDFISGAVYALDAQIVKAHSQTFIFALNSLDIEPVLSEYTGLSKHKRGE